MTAHPRALVTARSVDWQTVKSSNVHSALFDESSQDFYVRYERSGPDDIYVYPGRTEEEWRDFRTAPSKGGWIWSNARSGDIWTHERLTTRDFAHVERGDVVPGVRDFLF